MRIKEIITELFSPSFEPAEENNWRKIKNTPTVKSYSFDVGETHYELHLTELLGVGPSIRRVEFGLYTPGELPRWDILSREDGKAVKTAGGPLVLELSAYSIRRALEDGTIRGLFFTAKEPSRQKLYAVLASKMASETGWILQPDLAKWLNKGGKEHPYLIIDKQFADYIDKRREEEGDAARNPPLTRQPDTFGALPVRMD